MFPVKKTSKEPFELVGKQSIKDRVKRKRTNLL